MNEQILMVNSNINNNNNKTDQEKEETTTFFENNIQYYKSKVHPRMQMSMKGLSMKSLSITGLFGAATLAFHGQLCCGALRVHTDGQTVR